MTDPAPASALTLTRVLLRFRLRHARHAFWRGGGAGSRFMSFAALLLPVAYVGLFVSAFHVVAEQASAAVQVATLVLVVGGLSLASFVSKVTGGDAIVAGTGENEFFLSRPVDLGRLVVARALSSALLDVWGALFLVPVLGAAALVWQLGAPGVLVALLTSWLVQVGLVALGQAVSLGLLGRVPLAHRRLLQTGFGLLSAFSVALLWLVASFVLRQPERFAKGVAPWAGALNASPLAALVGPLVALRNHDGRSAWLGLLGLAAATAIGVALAAAVAARAGRRGWENAGTPFGHATPGDLALRRGAALSVTGKELRLLVRDRGRLVSLLAMPVLFVGVQLFGAVGFEAWGGDVRRSALLAYSLSAYLATLGPLPHMQGERRAFWVLRSVPVSLSTLMWAKAKAWLMLILAVGTLAFWGTVLLTAPAALWSGETWGAFSLVLLGCTLVCLLAVATGCNVADLSREGRNALGPGAIYVFLMVAGLFNVAIVREGELMWRTLCLYGASVALMWMTGVERAAQALDPERVRRLTPGDGALAAVLLFAGVHVAQATPLGLSPAAAASARAAWAALVALGAALFMWSVRTRTRGAGGLRLRLRALLRVAPALAGGAGAVALAQLHFGSEVQVPLVLVLAEELVLRGLLQRALQAQVSRSPKGRAFALVVALAIALMASVMPLSPASMTIQAISVIVHATTGRAWVCVAARAAAWLP